MKKIYSDLYHKITSPENVIVFKEVVNLSGYDMSQIKIKDGEITGPDGKNVWDIAMAKYDELLATKKLKSHSKLKNFDIDEHKDTYNNFAKYNPFGEIDSNPYKNLLMNGA